MVHETGESTKSVPTVFRANLSSPPMHVYCWNLYDGWAGEIVGDVANSVESGDTLVNFYFKPLWGGARAHNFIGIYVEGVTEGYGLLYSRVDTVREIETEECGWLCIASLFVPEYARQISVNITFLYMAYYWFYSFETGGGTVYSNAHWDIDLVIFQYRPADAEWHIIINEWLPPADLSAAVSNYIPPYYFDPETGQLTTGFYIFRDKGRFSYALEIPEGPCWLGVRFWLETSLEAFSCDEDTYGNAKAVTHLDVTDLTISVSFVKRAFEQAEMGYVDPANHTIVVGPDTPVNHTIRYGVAYSHTWDAFRFTIYVPDYADSLVSPVYETNHEDGLITGIFNTTSPNYVERLSAYIWRKDAKMLTIAYIRRSDGGKAMLDLYEPDNSIASAYNWTVNDYAEEIFVEDHEFRAVLRGRWKYIRNYFERTEELYNLDDDPMEVVNLAGRERDLTEELRERLNRWVSENLEGRPDPMWEQMARWAATWAARFGRDFPDLRPRPTIVEGVDR